MPRTWRDLRSARADGPCRARSSPAMLPREPIQARIGSIRRRPRGERRRPTRRAIRSARTPLRRSPGGLRDAVARWKDQSWSPLRTQAAAVTRGPSRPETHGQNRPTVARPNGVFPAVTLCGQVDSLGVVVANRLKVLFYGTPAFALPTFEALLRHHEVVAVVTQPDRPAHRGQHLAQPPVKERAVAAGIEVLQPLRVRDAEWPDRLRALGADVAVVVAFGQILPRAVLDAPRRGSINVHGSILPRYRGAAPIQWAIIRGERGTGITTFQMDDGMDTGPILLSAPMAIGAAETAGELAARLAPLGAAVLLETLARLDTLKPTPQRHADATLAPRLKRTDGYLDW